MERRFAGENRSLESRDRGCRWWFRRERDQASQRHSSISKLSQTVGISECRDVFDWVAMDGFVDGDLDLLSSVVTVADGGDGRRKRDSH